MGFFYSGLRSCLCPGGGSNPGILYAGPTFSPLSQGAGGWPSRFAGFCGGFLWLLPGDGSSFWEFCRMVVFSKSKARQLRVGLVADSGVFFLVKKNSQRTGKSRGKGLFGP